MPGTPLRGGRIRVASEVTKNIGLDPQVNGLLEQGLFSLGIAAAEGLSKAAA